MAGTLLEQYRIADLLEWYKEKKLVINRSFQRRNVWSVDARVYLIDTILRKLSMPKMYMRTKIHLETRTSYREVVDGQQRLLAIIDFAEDRLQLTKRATEYQGLKYSDLDEELQRAFLSYSIGVEQLVNASDSEVLEVFSRLNSYTLSLNKPELRHATYQGDFKWAVHESSQHWAVLWEKFEVVSVRERLRMHDDSLVAEMFGILINGVTDGGQDRIGKLYAKYDEEFPQSKTIVKRLNGVLEFIIANFESALAGPVGQAPHFLMLFAATAHAMGSIPRGDMGEEHPVRNARALQDITAAGQNLMTINGILEYNRPQAKWERFWEASKATTHRIASRQVRFPVFYKALCAKEL